jgi:ubiquinone/menaquinone biosynthesis C-methylase UbiE
MSQSEENFGNVNYWDSRYNEFPFTFEWLEDYNSLKPHLSKILNDYNIPLNEINILDCGCGTSEISENLNNDLKINNIYSIDYSSKALEIMKNKFPNSKINYKLMDITELNFKENFFDIIIDKGTTDNIYCYKNPLKTIAIYYKEINKVLKNNGYFLIISHSELNKREINISNICYLNFEIQTMKLFQTFELNGFGVENKINYLFICKKKDNSKYNDEIFNKFLEEIAEKEKLLLENSQITHGTTSTIKDINIEGDDLSLGESEKKNKNI